MTITLNGTSGIVAPALDLTTPLAVVDGGSGSSVIKPYRMAYAGAKEYNWNGLTTNTFLDFEAIPNWVKRITVLPRGISTNGTSIVIVQLGDSGGIENTAYISHGGTIEGANTGSTDFTTGFGFADASAATHTISGKFTIDKQNENAWVFSGSARHSNIRITFGAGEKTLSGILDRIRLTTVNGTDVIDAGSVNVMYEGYED